MGFEKVAIFGASGQIGHRILDNILNCESQEFSIRCFVPREKLGKYEGYGDAKRVSAVVLDLEKLSRESLAAALKGVDVVISALNGDALEAQGVIQDAAADAGVQRFYPSEFGMHHIYRKPGDAQGYIHPVSSYGFRLEKYDS
jgi:putative NADH-flavin reductase